MVLVQLGCLYGQDEVKPIKHFFRPTFSFDLYATPYANVLQPDSRNRLFVNRSRLRNATQGDDQLRYRLVMTNFSFFAPVLTRSFNHNDGRMSNLHVLVTGNLLFVRPDFTVISNDHRLSKLAVGIRAIYTDGYKSTLFVNFTPFIANDQYSLPRPTLRYWGSVVYNRTVNKWFSYRFGYISSYMLADVSVHLPFVGVRIGRLDQLNLQVSLPRNISVNLPVLQGKLVFSVFTRPIGGIFNYNNRDSSLANIHPFFKPSVIGNEVQFRFLEYLFGCMIDVKAHSNFSFYIGAGLSTQRYFGFAFNRPMYQDETVLRAAPVNNTVFINIGCTVSIGKAKRTTENYQMQDAFQVNSIFDAGDNNLSPRDYNATPPPNNKQLKPGKKSHVDYKEVKDLLIDVD